MVTVHFKWFTAPYRHLDGAVFDTLTRPHVLVMDTRNAMVRPERRKERDQMFVSE